MIIVSLVCILHLKNIMQNILTECDAKILHLKKKNIDLSLNMLKQIFCGIFFRWRILTDDNIYLSCNYGYHNVLFTFVAYLCPPNEVWCIAIIGFIFTIIYYYSSTHFCPLDFSEMPWSNFVKPCRNIICHVKFCS